jgi:hypothetical protein
VIDSKAEDLATALSLDLVEVILDHLDTDRTRNFLEYNQQKNELSKRSPRKSITTLTRVTTLERQTKSMSVANFDVIGLPRPTSSFRFSQSVNPFLSHQEFDEFTDENNDEITHNRALSASYSNLEQIVPFTNNSNTQSHFTRTRSETHQLSPRQGTSYQPQTLSDFNTGVEREGENHPHISSTHFSPREMNLKYSLNIEVVNYIAKESPLIAALVCLLRSPSDRFEVEFLEHALTRSKVHSSQSSSKKQNMNLINFFQSA